jgi:hypothetical protein
MRPESQRFVRSIVLHEPLQCGDQVRVALPKLRESGVRL